MNDSRSGYYRGGLFREVKMLLLLGLVLGITF